MRRWVRTGNLSSFVRPAPKQGIWKRRNSWSLARLELRRVKWRAVLARSERRTWASDHPFYVVSVFIRRSRAWVCRATNTPCLRAPHNVSSHCLAPVTILIRMKVIAELMGQSTKPPSISWKETLSTAAPRLLRVDGADQPARSFQCERTGRVSKQCGWRAPRRLPWLWLRTWSGPSFQCGEKGRFFDIKRLERGIERPCVRSFESEQVVITPL